MDDLNAMLSQVLSDPDSMRQIQEMAASLGLVSDKPPAPLPQTSQAPDLSALAGLLGGLSGGNNNQNSSQSSNQPPDLSALAGLLGSLGGGNNSQNGGQAPGFSALPPAADINAHQPGSRGNGFDVSALASLLNAGNPPQEQAKPALPFDMGTLLKLQQAMTSLQNSKSDINLLLALKPRLKPERGKKVDDAIKVMQLIQFLPLIKETGLFGEMDNILGSLGGSLTGAGGTGALGNILHGILGGRR